MTEQDVQANAEYMAAHLKEYGWEYVVVDIQWYAYGAGSMRSRFQYIPFSKLEMDEYSRLLPCPERFPSAAGGEIRMLHQAIQAAGRPIVLSLSPGEENMTAEGRIETQIAAHGAKLYRIL